MNHYSIREDGVVLYRGRTLDESCVHNEEEMEGSIAAMRVGLADKNEQTGKMYDVFVLLAPVLAKRPDIQVECYDSTEMTIWCDTKDLAFIAAALGPIKVWYKDVDDPKKRTLRITRKAKNHERVHVKHIVKMPRPKKGEKPKCQIVKSKSVSYDVVCGI